MKYIINNKYKVEAKDSKEAIKVAKMIDSKVKDEMPYHIKRDGFDFYLIKETEDGLGAQYRGKSGIIEISKRDAEKLKIKDADIDFNYLLNEERRAVKDYENAINLTENEELINLFSHIRDEELEHIQELERAKENKFEDSIKDEKYYLRNYNNKWYYEIVQNDGFKKLIGPYISAQEARAYFAKHRPNEILENN